MAERESLWKFRRRNRQRGYLNVDFDLNGPCHYPVADYQPPVITIQPSKEMDRLRSALVRIAMDCECTASGVKSKHDKPCAYHIAVAALSYEPLDVARVREARLLLAQGDEDATIAWLLGVSVDDVKKVSGG